MRARCTLWILLWCGLLPRAGAAATERFFFPISGRFVVPPCTARAEGSADLYLDTSRETFEGFIAFGELLGNLTSVQIRGPTGPLEIGPLVAELGTTRHVMLAPISRLQIQELEAEEWYLDVRTTAYPDGEERGQIRRATGVQGCSWTAIKQLFQ